jgi:hypothetical protein
MRGDRQPFSPTDLSQLSRCEQQWLFDQKYGAKRSAAWRQRSAEGRQVHAEMHRDVTGTPKGRRPLLITVIIALVALLLIGLVLRSQAGASTDELLPPELKGAKLEMSERSLTRQKPVHIRGRPDEVWLKDGQRYIVETKSRAGRVFEGDRMQMAAYAYLLRGQGGAPVASHGFVRFTGGEGSFVRVKLPGDDKVIEGHRRLQALRRRKADPCFASQKALCRGCGHIERCPSPKPL